MAAVERKMRGRPKLDLEKIVFQHFAGLLGQDEVRVQVIV
jgi:hypothetical protein